MLAHQIPGSCLRNLPMTSKNKDDSENGGEQDHRSLSLREMASSMISCTQGLASMVMRVKSRAQTAAPAEISSRFIGQPPQRERRQGFLSKRGVGFSSARSRKRVLRLLRL